MVNNLLEFVDLYKNNLAMITTHVILLLGGKSIAKTQDFKALKIIKVKFKTKNTQTFLLASYNKNKKTENYQKKWLTLQELFNTMKMIKHNYKKLCKNFLINFNYQQIILVN